MSKVDDQPAQADWRPIDQTPSYPPDYSTAARRVERFRFGWIFAAVWLFYLADPISAIHDRGHGLAKAVAYVAIVLFALLYVGVFIWARQHRQPGGFGLPMRRRIVLVAGLLALGLLTIPAAGSHGTATFVYVSASAMMLLPVRYAWGLVATMVGGITLCTWAFSSWHGEGGGNALGTLLAGFAVFGMRLAFDRNIALIKARDEVAQLAVSAERERMARDMHDILGHSLTVITVKAELAGRLIDVDPARARAEIADLERLSREALADVRATIGGYREVTLSRELANAKSALTAAGILPDLPGAVDEVPGDRRELFGWAVREGVTNVVRHSGAARCTVRVTRDQVEVIDDGRGVGECSQDEEADRTPGRGLVGLRQRATAAGATMTAGRGDAGGFCLSIEVR